jgi:hypothetical protein
MAKPTSIVALLKTVPPLYAHCKLQRGPTPSALGTWSDAGAGARRRRRCTAAVYCEIVAASDQTPKGARRCNGVVFALRALDAAAGYATGPHARFPPHAARCAEESKKQASRPRRGKRRCAASKAAVWVCVQCRWAAHVCGVRKRSALRPVGRVRGKVEASLLFTTPLQIFESRSWGLLSSPRAVWPSVPAATLCRVLLQLSLATASALRN